LIGFESLVISAATWLLQSFRKLYRVTSRILGVDDKDARVGIECCAKTSTKRPPKREYHSSRLKETETALAQACPEIRCDTEA
jgi:hypothetical protein